MPRESMLFMWTITVLYLVCKENIDAKIKLMRSLGWLEAGFHAAFRKTPKFLSISEKELQ